MTTKCKQELKKLFTDKTDVAFTPWLVLNEVEAMQINLSVIDKLDILIRFVKQAKRMYINNTNICGICDSLTHSMLNLNKEYGFWIINKNTLRWLIARENASKFGANQNDFVVYWWPAYYEPTKDKSTAMARYSKPRIQFLDWCISVLLVVREEFEEIDKSLLKNKEVRKYGV